MLYVHINFLFLHLTISCIEGYDVTTFKPTSTEKSSPIICEKSKRHIILTAETHNFPTGSYLV